jgi:hypothetical protein
MLVFISVIIGLVIAVTLWISIRQWLKNRWIHKAIHHGKDFVMLEILVPKELPHEENTTPVQLQETISVMEQFLSTLSGFHVQGSKGWFGNQPTFSLEIVARYNEIRFFIGTPREFEAAIEKQILGYYPEAQVERSQAFRITEPDYAIAGGQFKLMKKFIFPIQTYTELEADPLQTITTSLSKMGTDNRAIIQILLQPTDNMWRVPVESAIRRIQEGKDVVTVSQPWWVRAIGSTTRSLESPAPTDAQKTNMNIRGLSPSQQLYQKLLQEKGSKLGFKTTINVMTVAPHKEEAQFQLGNILSAFSQYNTAQSNGFRVKRIKNFRDFLVQTMLRMPLGKGMILNTTEIASIFHPPNYSIDTPGIMWLMAKFAPAPPSTPNEGVLLGENVYRGQHRKIFLKDVDRLRHLYAVGMTGTGKSTLFESMILQDIRAGKGVCYIDPHGDVVESILGKIPKERADDVIYFDPGNLEKPIGLNLLEWHRPEEKDFLINEFLLMFYKLFDPNRTGMIGPQFEHWARNAALTVMANPKGGSLIEIPRLFTDDAFRDEQLRYVQDPVVLRFWNEQMAKTADFHKSEMFNYFISKFGRFMTNELMRNIIGQPQSGINFREIMDSGKILLVNLSKGKIGDVNAQMLGMIIVAKMSSAALSRQDIPNEADRRDFYLYVDEFQNLATDTFATILSEARKYRLNLNITHQYIAQLPEDVRNAVFGNVGTIVSFRVGADDAQYLAHQFTPVFTETDMVNIERYNAYVKMIIDNAPQRPFSLRTLRDDTQHNPALRNAIVELSQLKHGRNRAEVDALIQQRAGVGQSVGIADAVTNPKGGTA